MTAESEPAQRPQPSADDGWISLGTTIAPGAVMATSVGSKPIVVWRTMRGRVVALDDRCPHQGNALSAGAVVGESLRCPVHGWEVASDGWCDRAGGATRSHPTRVAGGEMYIRPRA